MTNMLYEMLTKLSVLLKIYFKKSLSICLPFFNFIHVVTVHAFNFIFFFVFFFCGGMHCKKNCMNPERNTQKRTQKRTRIVDGPLGWKKTAAVSRVEPQGSWVQWFYNCSREVQDGSCSRGELTCQPHCAMTRAAAGLRGVTCQSLSSESYLKSCMISLKASLFLIILERTRKQMHI